MKDADLLRRWRAALSWSQEQAARQLDVSLRHYQRYELRNGHSVPPKIWRQTLVAILPCSS